MQKLLYHAGFLKVLQIDLQEEQNRREHHTDLFASPNLIVRRGQEFRISITFDGPYNPSKDGFYVEFRIGVNPQIHKQTAIIVSPNQDNKGPWQSQLLENRGNIIEMGITPSANCIVGKFLMYAVVVAPTGLIRDKENSSEIYILFNSWAPDDTVFMHDDTERMEYVLNQVGTIYCGSISNVMKRPWHYGQLNSQDDNGVLTGKWSEDYSHGRAPTSWTGSVEILHLYASNGVPVNYAQCWVYAGVFNTFLRCLGIPSRVITNYNSAHDNDRSLKTDIIVDCNGKIDKKYTKDSIWNFHCWNECYMARPDLPLDFGGWQVVDATPQETSDGLYRCGPAPLYGIKQGVICYPYDSPFVFAEVNSDVIFYKRDKYGKLTKVSVNETYVGKMLLTKAIGQDVPINITELYKFPEGTMQERLALQMAESYGTEKDRSVLPKVDVEMKVTVKPVTLGEDFQLVLIFQSLGRSLYNVDVFVSGNVMYYTGVSGPEFMSTTLQVQVDPSRQTTATVDVRSEEYMNKLFGHGNLHFFITGKVKETGHMLNIMHPVSLISPQLTVKVRAIVLMYVFLGIAMQLDIVLYTPFSLHCSSIAPASTITWTQSFIPMDPGLKMLMACLDCEYLRQVCGTASVYINV
ncbi:Coagulation factor XIII A chain-like [Scleropages formosus]|uniref:Coagulation factor XIII A chain-like n=1 Tax=Scleropages formosus TaxID=113540 RepID=A0A0P7V2U9_SCLFO|nr:Coagulation factor XIII A chain-like [Scleropages formosus]